LKTSVEPVEGNNVKLTVTVSAPEVDKAIAEAYTKVANQVRVPGFRQGKAPRPIIDRHVGREQVLAKAVEDIVETTYPQAVDAEGLRPIEQPEMGELSAAVEGEDYTYVAEVPVRPELTLSGDWANLTVEVPPKEASAAEVDAQIEEMRMRFASLEPVEDRGVELGDYVLISFVSLVDGKPYEGNTVDKYLYETGAAQMPKEFDDALVGAKPGDEVTATFTIPDTTSNPEFVGKTATFDVTIHEIKAKQLPELDEEFATNAGGFDSMDALRADIKAKIDTQRAMTAEQEMERLAAAALAEHLEGTVPEVMIMRRRDNMVRDFFSNLEQRGISLKDYISSTGIDPEKMQQEIEQEARARVTQEMALEALFRAEGMEVTEADIDEDLAEFAKGTERTVEDIRHDWEEAGVLAVLKEQVMQRKATKWLLEHATLVEKAPEGPAESAEPAAKPKKARKSAKKKEEVEQ
jgi:trigger factor